MRSSLEPSRNRLTRRGLLAAAAVAPLFGGKLAVTRDRLSVLTDEVAETPEGAIEFAHNYRLRWVELRSVPRPERGGDSYALMPRAELKDYAARLKDNGIGVSFLNTGLLKTWLPGTEIAYRKPPAAGQAERAKRNGQDHFDRRFELLDKSLEAAEIFGVSKLRVFTFLRTATPEKEFPRVAEILAEMGPKARKANKQLLIENEVATNVATCAETAKLLKMLPGKEFGVNWDPMNGHAFQEQPFPDGYRLLPKHRIGNVQIKGATLLRDKDRLDWAAIMQTLNKDGYRGHFGLETHIWDPPGVVEYSHRSMAAIERLLEES